MKEFIYKYGKQQRLLQQWYSRPISIMLAFSRFMGGIVFKQIQHYFSENSINSEVRHAYKKGYLTCTALTQLTDDWLKHIDKVYGGYCTAELQCSF